MKRLTASEAATFGLKSESPLSLIKALQRHNITTRGIRHNGILLSRRQQCENFAWIKNYEETGNDGHLTSCCDPFLCLLAYRLKWSIKIDYQNKVNVIEASDVFSRVVNFKASRTHFS